MRKTQAVSILLALTLFLALSVPALAANIPFAVQGGNIYFDPATGTITDADATVVSVTIPDNIGGITVTTIGDNAFKDCNNLVSITFPETIRTIKPCAFQNCTELLSVVLPDSIRTVGDYAFMNCNRMTQFTIPDGIETLSYAALEDCLSLTKLEFPGSLKVLSAYLCSGCTGLQEVMIHEGVTQIYRAAFLNCTSLESIYIPKSVIAIHTNETGEPWSYLFIGAFEGCNNLKDIYYAGSILDWGNISVGEPTGRNIALSRANIHYENPIADKAVHFPAANIYYQGQYSDVPETQWYSANVASAFALGLMKGNDDGTFNPYGDVTLAQTITMASRIQRIYTNGYDDLVQGSPWYQVYLDYALDNGIISRAYYNADVDQKATRAQFAEIFANSLPDVALYAINHVTDNVIPDVRLSDAYGPHVYKLYRAGILSGSDANGTFNPASYITRAEAAAIVSRMAESDNRVSLTLG